MSKAPWKREPETGIPENWITEDRLDDRGRFIHPEGCNCGYYSAARAAGFGDRLDKFNDAIFTGVGSYWHLVPVRLEDGHVVFFTHTDSAAAGRENYKQAAKARQLAGKKAIDVTPGY